MSVQGHGIDITLIAGADLSAKQFYAVKLDSNGAAVVAGDGEDAVGILQNKPASGQAATVRVVGISKFVAGGAISLPNRVASDANGKAKAAVAGRTNTSDAGASADALLGSFVQCLAPHLQRPPLLHPSVVEIVVAREHGTALVVEHHLYVPWRNTERAHPCGGGSSKIVRVGRRLRPSRKLPIADISSEALREAAERPRDDPAVDRHRRGALAPCQLDCRIEFLGEHNIPGSSRNSFLDKRQRQSDQRNGVSSPVLRTRRR